MGFSHFPGFLCPLVGFSEEDASYAFYHLVPYTSSLYLTFNLPRLALSHADPDGLN